VGYMTKGRKPGWCARFVEPAITISEETEHLLSANVR
jgi:hypothetical protein